MSCFRLMQIVTVFSLLLSMLVSSEISFGGTQAQVGAQDDRTAEVNTLIRDLRDPRFVVREAASKKLAEIGMPAVAALKLAAESDSLEVQIRAKSILSSVQSDRSSLSDSEGATVKQFIASDKLGRVAILKRQKLSMDTQLFFVLLDICVADEERASSSGDEIESAIEELLAVEVDNPLERWVASLLDMQRWEELNKLLTHPGILKYSPMLRAGMARNEGRFDAYIEDRYQWFSKAQVAQETLSTRELMSLIGLLRVKRDFNRAEKVIAALPDAALQRRLRKELLFQQGDWKEILRRTKLDPADTEFILANPLQQVLLHHLLGDQAAIAGIEQQLRRQLQASVEAAGEENTSATQLLENHLRILAAVTMNWPLMKEFLGEDNLNDKVTLMSTLNRHAEILELVGIGPRFKDRQTWVKDLLKEINEVQEKRNKNPRGRRDPDYSRLSQIIDDKQQLLGSVVGVVEQWGLDDEAQLYCQMIYGTSSKEEVLRRLAELGRTKEYWQLVESLLTSPNQSGYTSGHYGFGIDNSDIKNYASHWSTRIGGAIVDPVEKAKTIAAIMNSPLLDREGMDFDLDYELARYRTQSTLDSSGQDEFWMGRILELHGKDEVAGSLLKQAAQLGHAAAINAQFVQAMAKEDLYGVLEGGDKTERCMLSEEAALKILETETDPEKIRLVKKQLALCQLAIAAQWTGDSYLARRNVGHLGNFEKSQLASLHLQCLTYGVPGDVHSEGPHRRLGNILLAEGSDAKQQGAIEIATEMFDDLSYATGDQQDISWSFSAIYLNIALGKGMIASKDYDRAVDFLVRTAEFSLGDVSVGEGTIKELTEAGAVEEADQVYRAIEKYYIGTLSDYPDSPIARNNFAWLSAISNRDLESARRHVSVAVKMRPHVENYWDTFAEIEFLRGKPKEAFEMSRRCIQLSPERYYYRQQKERFGRAMDKAE